MGNDEDLLGPRDPALCYLSVCARKQRVKTIERKSETMAFRCVGSPMDEMKLLERMRARAPESASNVVANGKLLVEYAQQGNLRAIQCALDHMQEDHVLFFYAVRMFRAACACNRLDILRFMLAHGFEMEQVGMRDILHSVVDDITDEQSAEAAQPLVRFLMEAGVDVNWQRKSDLFTALHVACLKNLYAIAYLLIIYGADVNAIAMNDEMPLTCAEMATANAPRVNESTVDFDQNKLLVSLLAEHNARRTWRTSKQSPTATPETKPERKTILSFSGAFSMQCQSEDDEQQRQHVPKAAAPPMGVEKIAAATAGIMLDTPELCLFLKRVSLPSQNSSVPSVQSACCLSFRTVRVWGPASPAKEKKARSSSQKTPFAPRSDAPEALRPTPHALPHAVPEPSSHALSGDMSAPSNPRSGEAAPAPLQSAGTTLAVVAQALQDAAQLADRYGSTGAARERLDMLEREQEGLNDMIVVLRTRLRQAQRATSSAEAEAKRHKAALISANAIATIAASGSSIGGVGSNSNNGKQSQSSSSLFDANGFVNFLKRKFACRGDMSLLLDALFEFQTQQSDGYQQQQSQQMNESVVLLTIEEVQTSIPSSSPAASSSSARADGSYSLNVNTAATPTNSSNNNNNSCSSSMLMSNSSSSSIAPNSGAYNGDNSSGRNFGNLGIGIHNSSYYHRQSPEEEEQEIHLAAKQLLSPVTFTHVEEDEEVSKPTAGAPSQQFVPIRHSLEAERTQQERPSPSSSFIRAQDPDDESKQQLKKILPKKPRVKKPARAPSPLPSPSNGAHENQGGELAPPAPHSEPATKKRKVVAEESSLVIKQNLVWPAERRNITEMKHSSRFLELSVLENLDKQTPWNEMYKRRPLYSHVINYRELDDRAKTWFVTTLKIQFVWRRELWERLHWLPMSESVCTGAAWEKYRQTRKRRAKHAVTAWRKVYAQSIQMIEAGILPDDIWCDPALWYMPANPIYWLPDSGDVLTELAAIDEKHAVRCYHVYDLSRHPFYALGLVDKYPDKHELPSFSATSMQHPSNAEDDLANFGLKDAAPLLADLTPRPSQHQQYQHQHHPKVIITKDSSGPLKKRGPRVQKLSTQPQQQQQQQHQMSTVVVPQKLKTGAAAPAAFTTVKVNGEELDTDPATIASNLSAGS